MTAIDGDRLLARLDALAQISSGGPGVNRLAYGQQDVVARDLVAVWMTAAGLTVTLDEATNLIGRLPGRGGCSRLLVMGSHLDTVVNAGPLDGAYGVLAAIEVAAASHSLEHELVVVAFANEEGARGTAGLSGSRAIGRPSTVDLDALDDDGVSLAARVRGAGGAPDAIGHAAWVDGSVVAYVELHVEQGPILDRSGCQIGVVEAITGQRQFDIEVLGEANHAGTTPMEGRRDALVAAAELVLAVERLAADGGARVATTGRCVAEPGVRNVVPGRVHLAVDLRDTDAGRLETATGELLAAAQRIGSSRQVAISVERLHDVVATPCHGAIRDAVAASAEQLGLTWRSMVSGATHDGQSMSAIGPVGMVFVPSTGGVSHAPTETTPPDDLVNGANVVLATIVQLDRGALCDHTVSAGES